MRARDVQVVGTGMTTFGMFVDRRLREQATVAAEAALDDSGLAVADVGMVFFANAVAGLVTGQEMVRGQTALGTSRLAGLPMVDVENACASSSSAFHLATMAIESGAHDVVVVVGAEKMTDEDRSLAGRALATAIDVELAAERRARRRAEREAAAPGGKPRPVFMEIYAAEARAFMERTGTTETDLAAVVVKSSFNGSLNPCAQHRQPLSVEDILGSRTIAPPLTRPMCSSIGDGAAALVLCSADYARAHGLSGPRVLSSVVTSGWTDGPGDVVERAVAEAYAEAGVGPGDLDMVEVHDAAAPAELEAVELLGLADPGGAAGFVADGHAALGGRCPVNPSGGLLSRGHPIGATGAAQLVEVVDQLRGRCGGRQIEAPTVGLCENAGGSLGRGPAACAVTVVGA